MPDTAISTVLFDLDLTLVNSAALEELRRNGQWSAVMQSLQRIVPYPHDGTLSPHQLPNRLKLAGFKIGIVTSSPEQYASAVIQMFGIQCDTLVSSRDTTEHKPDPEPLLLAAKQLKVKPSDCIYVGDETTDFEASYRAGMRSIGAGWGSIDWTRMGGKAPDTLARWPKQILDIPQIHRRGYVGDVEFAGSKVLWHPGSFLGLDNPVTGWALGRYFPRSDSRHGISKLSQAILSLKNEDTFGPQFATIIERAFSRLELSDKIDGILAVPPKPGQTRDRFACILNGLKGLKRPMYPDGLECVRDYESLKTMNGIERRAAVKGAFRTNYNWRNHRLLLLDDVFTTAATTSECISTLLKEGVKEVSVMVLARDQMTMTPKACPQCRRIMRVRQRSRDKALFWGCSGYPNHCKYTENY